MNKIINLFVVSTPLQMINAFEAKKYYGIGDEESLLVVIYLENRLDQLRAVVETLEWVNVLWLESEEEALHCSNGSPVKKIMNWISGCRRFLRRTADLGSSHQNMLRLFIGNYLMLSQLQIAHVIKAKEIVLLDDGHASLTTAKLREAGRSIFQSRVGVAEKTKFILKKFMMGFRFADLKEVVFFTAFEFQVSHRDRLVKNNYINIRKSLSSKSCSDEVYFLGAPLVELNVIGFDDYCMLLDKVFAYLSEKKIIYVKHPGETLINTEAYLSARGIETIKFPLPIEMIYFKNNLVPAVTASFYSSALTNIRLLLGATIDCIAFQIPDNAINVKFRQQTSAVYDYLHTLKGNSFRVVSLDLQ